MRHPNSQEARRRLIEPDGARSSRPRRRSLVIQIEVIDLAVEGGATFKLVLRPGVGLDLGNFMSIRVHDPDIEVLQELDADVFVETVQCHGGNRSLRHAAVHADLVGARNVAVLPSGQHVPRPDTQILGGEIFGAGITA